MAWSSEHLNNRDRTIKTSKYLISSIQGIMTPVDIDIAARVMSLLGPIRMQHDFLLLINVKNFRGSLTTVVRAQNDTSKTANITDTIFNRTLV